MTLPGLVRSKNLSDVEDKEKAWDSLGNQIDAEVLANTGGVIVKIYDSNYPADQSTTDPFVSFRSIKIESEINFARQYDIDNGGSGDNFALKIEGQVQASGTGVNSFAVAADDGVRVRFNGLTVVDAWQYQPLSWYPFSVNNLTAGSWYNLEIDFFQGAGGVGLIFADAINGIPVTALRTNLSAIVDFSIKGADVLALNDASSISPRDFVYIKGLTSNAQQRITVASQVTASGVTRQAFAMPKNAPTTSGAYFFPSGATLSGSSLQINGANALSIATSPFSGDTATTSISIDQLRPQANWRISEPMASGLLSNAELAIPFETSDFVLFVKAGQS